MGIGFPVMAPENFLSGYFLTFVLDTPEKREIIRRQLAGLLHRHLTSPPSLWPGCELQKYHYPCMSSWPCRLQSDIYDKYGSLISKRRVMAYCPFGSDIR